MKDINRRLRNSKMPLSVHITEQCNFEELLHIDANDLIECEVGYESCDPTDALEMYYYNQSYGV